jgi:hypothetical protein
MRSMKPVSSSSTLTATRSSALSNALRDPKVEELARSLNLDLRDPDTLNNLLAQTKQTIEASTHVSISMQLAPVEHYPVMDMEPVQISYVRNALRTYQSIDSMR